MKRMGLILGLVIFLLGIVAVVHPTFQYGARQHVATLDEPKTFQVPIVATVALLVSGFALVIISFKVKP